MSVAKGKLKIHTFGKTLSAMSFANSFCQRCLGNLISRMSGCWSRDDMNLVSVALLD